MKYDIKDFRIKDALKYQTAEPFEHIVIEDFMNAEVLTKISEEFPDLYDLPGDAYNTKLERKKISQMRQYFSALTNDVINYLNSEEFLQQLQFLTCIERKLIADNAIIGGGLHQTKCGGLLKIHTDFNKHQ